ncbi:MAG: aminomethyl-transferring glycine dehydrogenase subunit GcvPA [Candidatus Margulisiibacteriota bacterium]|jgi:glycine dehydrogenase subunit 1
MNFLPHTKEDVREMLSTIGIKNIDELFNHIPENLKIKELDLPAGQDEFTTLSYFTELAKKNKLDLTSFLGGGFYDHYIPSAIDALVNRSEFYTAYTPYQPEASQGTLQALFEYQTVICRLAGLDAANASLYDGGTALAEAILMALRITGKSKIIIDDAVNPIYRKIIKTYLKNLNVEIIEIVNLNFALDEVALKKHLDQETAAVVLQNPNFFGTIDDYSGVVDLIHENKALAILSFYPISLGILKTPSEMGFDIATAEGQSLGIPLSFGGPYLGILAAKKEYIRQIPGRIVGQTVDKNQQRGFVLTLQAREQHIRREKATSNICSNQGLCALRALIYLSLLGPKGLKELAELNLAKAELAKKEFVKIGVIKNQNTFNEFVVDLKEPTKKIWQEFALKNIMLGLPLETFYPQLKNEILVTVTEKTMMPFSYFLS